jgi:hypothetical protein
VSVDIRRMSKAQLDELNRLGKEWRERNKPVQDQKPKPKKATTILATQLDLWEATK